MNPIERKQQYHDIIRKEHPTERNDLSSVYSALITTEDGVWISLSVTLSKGVKIGARSVIATSAILTKGVPPDTFYRNLVTPILTSNKEKVNPDEIQTEKL